ncbi:MAG: hypothetical protein ACSW75_01980 [Lachnospiraceae bacterium]
MEENKVMEEKMEEVLEKVEEAAEAVEEVTEQQAAAEEALEEAVEKAEEAEEGEEDGIEIEITIEPDADAEKKAESRFFKKTDKGFEVDTKEIEASFKSLGEKIAAAFNTAGQTLNAAREAAAQKANQKKKADKLAKMFPYMNEEEIHEIAEGVINGDDAFKDVELESLLPFMSEADCRLLFEKSLAANDETPGTDDIYLQCVPFVGEEALAKLVDRYVEGSYHDIKMDDIYPYLASKDVKRIFYYEMKKQ